MKIGDKIMVTSGPMKGQVGTFDGHPDKPEKVLRRVQKNGQAKDVKSIKFPGADRSKVIIQFPGGKKGTLPNNQVKKV